MGLLWLSGSQLGEVCAELWGKEGTGKPSPILQYFLVSDQFLGHIYICAFHFLLLEEVQPLFPDLNLLPQMSYLSFSSTYTQIGHLGKTLLTSGRVPRGANAIFIMNSKWDL